MNNQNYDGNIFSSQIYQEEVNMQKKFFENQCEIWKAQEKERVLSEIELSKFKLKCEIKERTKIAAYEKKVELRELEKERSKSVVEVIDVTSEGKLIVTTKNLAIETIPRQVTNMRSPQIRVLSAYDMEEPVCYMLSCFVRDEEKHIFLDSTKLSRGNYMIGKFLEAGIYFEIQPSKIRPLMNQLICRLLETSTGIEMLAENEGWLRIEDGKFKFFSEGDLTWRKVRRLMK